VFVVGFLAIWDFRFFANLCDSVAGHRRWGTLWRSRRDNRQKDLLRGPALEEIVDLGHPLVRLAREIDWGFPRQPVCRRVCVKGAGQAAIADAPWVAGLFILKMWVFGRPVSLTQGEVLRFGADGRRGLRLGQPQSFRRRSAA